MTQLEPSDARATRPAVSDPATEHRARLAVCARAQSAADAQQLLEMLGLVEHGEAASPGRFSDVGTVWWD